MGCIGVEFGLYIGAYLGFQMQKDTRVGVNRPPAIARRADLRFWPVSDGGRGVPCCKIHPDRR